jgi:hypothetical protein
MFVGNRLKTTIFQKNDLLSLHSSYISLKMQKRYRDVNLMRTGKMGKEEQLPFCIRFRFPTTSEPRPTQLLSNAFSILPDEVLSYFQKNPILFCGETIDHTAEAVRFNDDTKECKYIVHFHSRFWQYSDNEILYSILVHIAHCYLGHDSEFWSLDKEKNLFPKPEVDAHNLATQWTQTYIKNKHKRNGNIIQKRNLRELDHHFTELYR